MLDSLLTMTKRGAFWLAVFFLVSTAMHFGISAMVGMPEAIFLLISLALLAAFVISGLYTLGKTIMQRNRRR